MRSGRDSQKLLLNSVPVAARVKTRRDSDNPPLDATCVHEEWERLTEAAIEQCPSCCLCEGQERSCHWAISQLLPAATYQRLIEAAIGQCLREDQERLR